MTARRCVAPPRLLAPRATIASPSFPPHQAAANRAADAPRVAASRARAAALERELLGEFARDPAPVLEALAPDLVIYYHGLGLLQARARRCGLPPIMAGGLVGGEEEGR